MAKPKPGPVSAEDWALVKHLESLFRLISDYGCISPNDGEPCECGYCDGCMKDKKERIARFCLTAKYAYDSLNPLVVKYFE